MRKALAAVSLCFLAAACGSVTTAPVDGGGGSTGTGGGEHGGGSGGHGIGGAPGAGGQGAAGSGGVSGTGGSGGSGSGGAPGTGGGSGSGGAPGTGGAGGASACQAIAALDRSCSTNDDCVAEQHVANCCGTLRDIGVRASQAAAFATLEAACVASYPACRCPVVATTTDDGSIIKSDAKAGVACVAGVCTTFVPDCGHPCAAGTTCFTCVTHLTMYGACTVACANSDACHDPALPRCQQGTSGNVSGMYCTATNITCDQK